MIRLILKNLWSRRRKNFLLLFELIVITYLAWIIVDNIAVIMYDRSIPAGIDTDRLCYIDLDKITDSRNPNYDESRDNNEARFEDYRRLLDRVKELPEVENATFVVNYQGINVPGYSTNTVANTCDTTYSLVCAFVPGYNFFEVYGINDGYPSRPAAELSNEGKSKNGVILTQYFADRMARGDSLNRDLRGVVGNVKMFYPMRSFNTMFIPIDPMGYDLSLVLRLRPDIDPKDFAYDYRNYVSLQLRSGNIYGLGITDYDTLGKSHTYTRNANNFFRMCMILLVFFLACLFLGVIGTYYLQTRQRSNEAGIMKSYGASRGHIVRMMLGEATILTFTGWLAGSILFLNFPATGGLSGGINYMGGCIVQPSWVDNYALHASIVAALVLVTLLIPTLIGVYIPSRKVSRVNPVDALRDE